jgi:ribonuclease G
MQKLMSHDRAKHNVLPLSKFGLMQITRQRVRPAVEMNVMETCPTCMGKGKIQASLFFTDQVVERIEAMVAHYGRGLRLHLHPYIYAYITKGWFNKKLQWAMKYGVRVIENQSLGMLETTFYRRNGEEKYLIEKPEDKACEKQ